MEERKITLAKIKLICPFDNAVIAKIAEVNPIVIHWILIGQPVARWQAVEVLKVLSMMMKEDYRLDTVQVVLFPEAVTEE